MAKYTSKTALQLTGSDIRSMSRNELAKAVSTISSAANKRITRLEKAGQTKITETWQRFSVAGKSRAELMREFTRVKNFMKGEQLSLSGQARIRSDVQTRLAETMTPKYPHENEREYGKRVSKTRSEFNPFFSNKEQFDKFWRTYDMAKEKDPELFGNKQYKYRVLREQKKIMVQNPFLEKDEIVRMLQDRMDSVYKRVQSIINEDTETDGLSIITRK